MVTKASWQRARRPDQKAVRRADLLRAAERLLRRRDFDQVSVSDIAEASGVAKGNVYRYFATKEELFLALYERELGLWVRGLARTLGSAKRGDAIELIADALTDSIVKRPLLCELAALLSLILERNVSVDAAARFKLGVRDCMLEVEELLGQSAPALEPGCALELLHDLHALVAGLWPMTHPAPVLDAVLDRPELAGMRLEFEPTLRQALRRLLRGFQNRER